MDVVVRKSWTVAEFLAWEERQELRYEFDGSRVVAMTGGTFEHDAIQINLVAALHARLRGKPCRLRGKPCRLHGNSLKIEVMGSIRYPDAFVTCTPVPRGSTVAHEPVVIFEVLSPSTAFTDRTAKNREYAGTESVRRYVMLEQRAIAGTMFVRGEAGWLGELIGPESVLRMPEIGVELPMAEIYEGLTFSDEAEGEPEE